MKYLKTRIRIYEQAIIDYELAGDMFLDWMFSNRNVYGFCWYFDYIAKCDIKELTEIMEFKPENKDTLEFWWDEYDNKIRIEKLKIALKSAKQKLR